MFKMVIKMYLCCKIQLNCKESYENVIRASSHGTVLVNIVCIEYNI